MEVLKKTDNNNWENDTYTVWKRGFDPTFWQLTIKRKDTQAIRSWKDMQQIKNEIIGPHHEGFEIFPAEDRLVDETNAYHIFVFRDHKLRVGTGLLYRRVKD